MSDDSDAIDETLPNTPDRNPATGPGEAAASAESDQLDAFDRLVFAAVESLPPQFRDRLGSVAIVVEDEATPDELAAVGAAGLLGLYTGVPRTAWGADGAAMSSKITIYRLPHLQQFRTPEALARGVADTVRHEVAHHFGISDARLDQLAREGHGH